MRSDDRRDWTARFVDRGEGKRYSAAEIGLQIGCRVQIRAERHGSQSSTGGERERHSGVVTA
jgi:hypothetical protein